MSDMVKFQYFIGIFNLIMLITMLMLAIEKVYCI